MPVAAAMGVNDEEGAGIDCVESTAQYGPPPQMTKEVSKVHFACSN